MGGRAGANLRSGLPESREHVIFPVFLLHEIFSTFLIRVPPISCHGVGRGTGIFTVIIPEFGRDIMAEEAPHRTGIRTLIVDPDTFFVELARQPPHYRRPLLIVSIAGVFSAMGLWLELNWLTSTVLLPEYFGVDTSWNLYPVILFAFA